MPRTFTPKASFTAGGQVGGQTAQLGVAETVGGRGLGLGDKGAVGVVDAPRTRPPGSFRFGRRRP